MRDDSAMAIVFRPGRSDEPPGRDLMRELNELFDAQYPGRAAKPGSVTAPDEMVAPHGTFLVGWEDGRAIAIGGVRRARGRRLRDQADVRRARRALARRRARAPDRARGRRPRARLRAGARSTPAPRSSTASTLFRRTGYVEIPKYNDNHIAVYFAEKQL